MMIVDYVPMLIALPLVGFWFWMFSDMLDNPDLSPASKLNWRIGFVLANLFAAGYYYFRCYRRRHPGRAG